ncbi:MAG: IMP dehydrogenase [Armatimonadetes bacterium]|nr:MAG: IMP dehydrogenase [Armatimonadota bacterium]MCE7899169.1 IMP dehydrogenase [Armatimonadetes bacterium ATM1]MDL1928951.1 IMP dehydrogenase [Fimbriimonadia bacterium ATM]MBC6969493.1 IMP dehydrogenase [Armatimonadota bacterium]MBL1150586.1 IMP dehydrogenase [Armatimonadota bacterium]
MASLQLQERLSFDDVLLLPKRTEVMPHEVDTATELVPGVKLRIPFVSAPMDTVTEARLAIAMAREGGVGVIHRNLSIGEQAEQVDRVKRSEHGIIHDPISLRPDQTIQEALTIMERYHISGVPVTDESGKLVGILTNRDIRFETEFNRPIRDRMTAANLVTGPVGTTLEQAQSKLQEHRIEKLPLVDDEGHLKGLITIKDIQKVKQFPYATKDAKGRLVVGAAIGALREPYERAKALQDAGADFVVIDAAHGHSRGVMECVKLLKSKLPDLRVVAGNVVDRAGVCELISLGADALRVGIGAGSICTTRVVAGVGVPQFSAVLECAEAAKDAGVPTIADGGIRSSGDIVKALAAGASAVMMGNMLAGCDESPGETEIYRNRAYKVYRGMGSISAMRRGSSDRYFAMKDSGSLVPEGVEGRVPYRGQLHDTIAQLIGGLRSGMGYVGASSLTELREKAEFVKITNAGLRESHPHDVWITKEPPNYTSPSFGGESD